MAYRIYFLSPLSILKAAFNYGLRSWWNPGLLGGKLGGCDAQQTSGAKADRGHKLDNGGGQEGRMGCCLKFRISFNESRGS